jgi:Na+/H+ antiporter NhaD/arsenite permease-like protein
VDQRKLVQRLPSFIISRQRKEELTAFLEEIKIQNGDFAKNRGTVRVIPERPPLMLKNEVLAKRGLIILGALVLGFLLSDLLGIPPVVIAGAGGLAAIFFSGIDKAAVFERLNYKALAFFAALFILVGAAQASGLMDVIGRVITGLSFGNILLQCILVMWLAAVIAAFCNAGPATAIFLPVVLAIQTGASPHNLFWWSLSLGVLAGSCATLTGATAGAISSSMMQEYSGQPLSFNSYLKIGLPISLMILLISTVYVVLLYFI